MDTGFRIIFMGTPEFAVPSLKALIAAGENIIAVITQPDKPKGRGRILTAPPIKDITLKYNIPAFQPEQIKDETFVTTIKDLSPDIIIVVAYGKILPKAILSLPPNGCINVHASLLPKYRGAAPINWAIINGETNTGITTMLLDEGMDTGNILLTERVGISSDDTASSLHDKLMNIGAELLIETINSIKSKTVRPVKQDDTQATYAPMLKKEDGRIDWSMNAQKIRNLIRGFNPWPGAYTRWEGLQIKIISANTVLSSQDQFSELIATTGQLQCLTEKHGTILKISAEGILIATGKGTLLIVELQPENKNRMTASEFIKGYKIAKGQILH